MPARPADQTIVKLRSADLTRLQALLRENRLPDDDCAEQAANFRALYEGAELVAAGGLEPAGDCVLLRSVVVRKDRRGRGLARQMTDYLLQQAEADGKLAVYLLTETAEGYFRRLGFRTIDRGGVPAAIRQTRQFASLCPDSASCLYLPLPRDRSPG
jgi:N-acetylglutamate synthase-like GNAT family acetyltransferase